MNYLGEIMYPIDLLKKHDLKYPWDDNMLDHYQKTLQYDNVHFTRTQTGYAFHCTSNIYIIHNILMNQFLCFDCSQIFKTTKKWKRYIDNNEMPRCKKCCAIYNEKSSRYFGFIYSGCFALLMGANLDL